MPRPLQHSFVRSLIDERRLCSEAPRLRAFCRNAVRGGQFGDDDVEDFVQETLIRAWTHRGRFEGRSKVSSWLGQILLNVIKDADRHLRTHKRSMEMPLFDTTDETRAAEAPLCGPPSDDRILLDLAREGLSQPQRDAYDSVIDGGQSAHRFAREAGLTLVAAQALVASARLRMALALGGSS